MTATPGHKFATDRVARARPRTPGEEVGQSLVLAGPGATFAEVAERIAAHRIHRCAARRGWEGGSFRRDGGFFVERAAEGCAACLRVCVFCTSMAKTQQTSGNAPTKPQQQTTNDININQRLHRRRRRPPGRLRHVQRRARGRDRHAAVAVSGRTKRGALRMIIDDIIYRS